MKCIGKSIKTFILTTCCFCLLTGCGLFAENTPVSQYEAKSYNKDIYREALFASDLCVASEDVSMENAPDTSGVYAAGLFDVSGKEVDFSYQVFDRLYPASTTKIMTALLAIENADLTDTVTVSEQAAASSFASDESVCELKEGDVLTLNDLLYGLLLCSGNDAAVAIAEHVSGNMDAFVSLMNQRAAELMATQTHFVNPHGLHDDNHYTTAYDLYLIFNECIKHSEFIDVISAKTYTVNITGADGDSRSMEWKPTNYYAAGTASAPENVTVIGGKTGTTKLAGNCLILLENNSEGNPYISVIMGAESKPLLYEDMTQLMSGISNNNE